MNDDFKDNQQKEIDDFLAQFEEITDSFNKEDAAAVSSENTASSADRDAAINSYLNDESTAHVKTRSERLAEMKAKKREESPVAPVLDKASAIGASVASFCSAGVSKISDSFSKLKRSGNKAAKGTASNAEGGVRDGNMTETEKKTAKKKKRKKFRINIGKLIIFVCILGLLACGAVGAYVYSIVKDCPEIDPDNIYLLLSQTSILYDNEGEVIATIGTAETRTNIEFAELPDNLVNAFIAIEDKTFWTHKGFNVKRIFGAIYNAIRYDDDIKGTSTITQQLARNVYLAETKQVRSLERKISEAYYAVVLERKLSKEQIIEAYLNTINLGYESYGVQAAAQSYFSKDVWELDLVECASLATLPKAPSTYAFIKKIPPTEVDANNDIVLYRSDEYAYIYNGDACSDRRALVLKNMLEQEKISQSEYDAAMADNFLYHIKPNISSLAEVSSYFADYAVNSVIDDYAEEYGMDYADAKQRVYTGGLQIYTTLDTRMQQIIDTEFANNENFPGVANLKKDSAGNIYGKNGTLLLYLYDNMIANDMFVLQPDEFEWLPDGSLKLLAGKRLNFYQTSSNGETEISIEFKNMYTVDEDGIFYSIQGGVIMIPREFKTRDEEKNAIISADFFKSEQYSNIIGKNSDGTLYVHDNFFTLRQKVVQPQSACVITDYHTGYVKAMVGGRNTTGVQLFNRATSPRQPGSSIKPVAVYGAALQQTYELHQAGSSLAFKGEGSELYGRYFTAASIIDDSPLVLDDKKWPKNWYTGYRGLYTFRTSVQQSVNVNAVKVMNEIGVDYAAAFAKKLGITSIVEEGEVNDMNSAALALGGMSQGVSPMEMASAYGTYPNGGLYIEPIVYTKVTNRHGELLMEKVPYSSQSVDPGVAFIMTDILRSVVTEGLGSTAAFSGQPVAGKTGTTTDNYDAWFVGFTPQYSAAVWIGNDVNIELSKGSASAAKVWKIIMSQVCDGLEYGSYPSKPDNVVSVSIDTKSGMLPGELSALDDRGTVRSEYFISGTQPTETDTMHQYAEACSESGYLATPDCPYSYQRFGVLRPYDVNYEVGDIDYEIPHFYCPIHNPDPTLYPTDPAYGTEEATVKGFGTILDPTQIPGFEGETDDPTAPDPDNPDATDPNAPVDPDIPGSDPDNGSQDGSDPSVPPVTPPDTGGDDAPDWL